MSFDRADIIEYPLLALLLSDELNENQNKNYVLRHVGIDNVSKMKYEVEPFKGFAPCFIYDTYYGQEDIEVRGNSYARAFSSQSVNVYRKE